MSKAFGMFRNFNHGEQEDAQEFLAFFLDQVPVIVSMVVVHSS